MEKLQQHCEDIAARKLVSQPSQMQHALSLVTQYPNAGVLAPPSLYLKLLTSASANVLMSKYDPRDFMGQSCPPPG